MTPLVNQVVASVVPVPDAGTAPLMTRFHAAVVSGPSPAAAPARARTTLTDDAELAAGAGFVRLGTG